MEFELVDIIPKLPPNFENLIADKKWQERKSALDSLAELLSKNPKLEDNPEHRQLVDKLTKILGTDSNIICAAHATKCLIVLAKGLRNKFGQYSRPLPATIFEKFKEKKAVLREPLVELIDVIFDVSGLSPMAPAILEAASKQNPSQKAQLDLFLYRAFRCTAVQDLPKGFLKHLVAALSEHIFDPDAEVRDAASAALGSLHNCVGAQALLSLLNNKVASDATKMGKIGEYQKKAEVEAAEIRAAKSKMMVDNVGAAGDSSSSNPMEARQEQPSKIDLWELLEPVDIVPKLPTNFWSSLEDSKWQLRKSALDSLNDLLVSNPKLADNAEHRQLVDKLTKILGTDLNIICAAQATKCLIGLAKGLRNKFGQYLRTLPATVFEKFKEKKAVLREPLIELIDAIFEVSGLTALAPAILEAASKQNPSQKAQLDLFLYRAFRCTSAKDFPKGFLKDLVAALTGHAFDPDPEVREAACAALGAIQRSVGDHGMGMLLGEKVSVDAMKMAKINEYCKKALAEAPVLQQSSVANGQGKTAATPRQQNGAAVNGGGAKAAEGNCPPNGRDQQQKVSKQQQPEKRPASAQSTGSISTVGQRKQPSVERPSQQHQQLPSNSCRPSTSASAARPSSPCIPPLLAAYRPVSASQRPSQQQPQQQSRFVSSAPTPPSRYQFAQVKTPSGSRIPRLVAAKEVSGGGSEAKFERERDAQSSKGSIS